MVDVIVYKPSPYALGFIIFHTKHERVYVSYKAFAYCLLVAYWTY